MIIDGKYKITVINNETGKEHNSEDSVLFLAKDKQVPGMINDYIERCKKAGCTKEFLKSISQLKKDVVIWQKEHKDVVRNAD